jgi:hypothetical protein
VHLSVSASAATPPNKKYPPLSKSFPLPWRNSANYPLLIKNNGACAGVIASACFIWRRAYPAVSKVSSKSQRHKAAAKGR